MIGMYGVSLIAAAAVGGAVYARSARRAGFDEKATPVFLVMAIVLGALGARLYYHAAGSLVFGMGFEGFALLSLYPYEYAMCGALLGVLLAAFLTAKLTGQRAAHVFDVLTPGALLALFIARLGEHFSDFGWGQVFENARWQFFPVAVMDMYEQWHLAVYMLEAVMALLVCLCTVRVRRGMPGDRFLTALLWWSASQIFCESLRAETIRWGFVRVQQLQCALFMLIVLLVFSLRAVRRSDKKPLRAGFAAYVLGIGVIVLMEYAIDKWDLAVSVCYALMAAALLMMTVCVQRVRPKLLPED